MWQPDYDLQAILAYLESSGLSREVIKARIFQIFVDKETPGTIVIKAGEMLLSFSDDDGYDGELPYSQLLIIEKLTKAWLGADDNTNLTRVIEDIGIVIQESEGESGQVAVPSFLEVVSFDNETRFSTSAAQSGDYGLLNISLDEDDLDT
jgi:hypothetical protein